MSEQWLLIKRGLYYMPNDCGYTGIRDHAGRYTAEEARARLGSGVTMTRLCDAPEFTDACYDDLAIAHLTKQRDALRHALEAVMPIAEAFKGRIDMEPALHIGREALQCNQRP